jgi:hypothetical protein
MFKRRLVVVSIGLFFLGRNALSFKDRAASRPVPATTAPAPFFPEEKTLAIVVPGNAAWTDTGVDVAAGQEISFEAAGKISLQKGNPQADCGPEGYDLRTIQQPLPEGNLGALIGKVVIAVTVTKDEKTGMEKKDEVAQLFFIGSESRVEMPAKGRLYLGINENVIGDNGGEFKVAIAMPEAMGQRH